MALLQYDFRVIGSETVHRAIASIEQRLTRHNAFVNRTFSGTPVARAGRTIATTGRTVADRVVRDEERASRQATQYWQRAAQRSADHRIREDERAHRQRMRQLAREENAERQMVRRAIRANATLARRERSEHRTVSRAITGNIGRSATGALGAVGSYGGAVLGLAGGFAAGSALQTQISETAQASRIANNAGTPQLKGDILRQAQGVKGFTGGEALGGIEAFVTKTGNLGAAREMLGSMSELALATGANLEDLGATAGQAFNVLKGQISDPVELLKQVKSILPALAEQGRMGAVEISDLATEFGKLGAATRDFEGGGATLMRTMGAFAQIAMEKGGASTSSDAATAASRMGSDIVTNRKKFEKLGVGVQSKTDKTKLRSPEEIILDVLEKTGGDITKTSGLFGMESRKIFKGMSATFSEAEAKKPGSGRAAAMAEFQKYAGATSDPAAIAEQAASRLADPDLQFKEAMKGFNAAIGSELLPVVTRLVPEFTALIPNVTKAVRVFGVIGEEIARDPISGIGKLIAAKVALDLTGAGIGAAARGALEASLNSGLSKGLGMAGLTVGTLAASVALAELVVTALKVEGESAAKGAVAGANEIREKAKTELLTTGKLSDSTRAELEGLQKTEADTLAKGSKALNEYDTGDFIRRGFNQLFGTGDGEDLSQLSRLGATASNEEYSRGSSETKQLLDIAANKPGLSADSVKELTAALTKAGDDFASKVAEAGDKLALNRTEKPASPVP